MRSRFATFACVLSWAMPSGAWAQAPAPEAGGPKPAEEAPSEEEAARAQAREAAQLIRDGDCKQALPKLEAAYAVLRVPTIARYSGYCMEKLGLWVEAVDRYLETTRLPLPEDKREVHEEAQRDAGELRRALLPRLPQLLVTVNGATAPSVTLDGEPVPLARLGTKVAVNPGLRLIEVVAADGRVERRETTAVEGQINTVDVTFEVRKSIEPPPAPVPAPSPSPDPAPKPDGGVDGFVIGGWSALGAGAAGAVLAAVSGGLLLSTDADLEESCVDDRCVAGEASNIDRFNTLRPLTTAGMVIGGVGLTTGVLLLLLAPDDEHAATEARVTPLLGPTSAGLHLRF